MKDEIVKAIQKVTGVDKVHVEFPEREEFGDYSSNVAMQLFSQFPISNFQFPIKKIKNPRQLADRIVKDLEKDKSLANIVSKIEVAGPGFINFWLSKEALLSELKKALNEGEKYGSSSVGKGKTVLVEYSSPNIAKAFAIGHLRSTIIGQALFNLFKFMGYKVIGDNHLGDWGTQFGALLAQIAKAQSSKLKAQNLNIDKLEELYVEFNKKAEANSKLWDEARAWFKKLEDGNPEARKTWKEIVDISVREFERVYEILGVKIDNAYGESFYEDKMQAVITEVRKKGLSKKSKGAEIIEFKELPPAILIKSDGATTYFTRDLATVKFRMEKFKPDLIIYEVGSEQALHFKQVFATAERMGWINSTELVHVPHGLIRFTHGKMATRTGKTVKLEEVLQEAVHRAETIIEKSSTSRGLSKSEKEDVARAVGIGAIKYFDLVHHPTSDIIFDWEKMFLLEGNSAPYLQYTVARTNSVLKKAGSRKQEVGKSFEFRNSGFEFNTEELLILRNMLKFPEVIAQAAGSYSPNLLCNYLFDLAQKYNAFYNSYRILEPEVKGQEAEKVKEFRIALTASVGQILKNGLTLTGIDTPERM